MQVKLTTVRLLSSGFAVYRLTASLALFFHQSPFHTTLIPLMDVLMVKQNLLQKLREGGCGATGVVKTNVRALIKEVANELCA
jgi:desumoylating isopeptidase 1